MTRWRVSVNGTNFRFEMQEETTKAGIRRMGFFTTVFVSARTAQDAESKAVAILRRDRALRRGIRNAPDDPPRLFVEDIQPIPSLKGCRLPRTGLLLYRERGPKRTR